MTTPTLSKIPLTISPRQFSKIRTKVNSEYIPVGIGDEKNACSIASINLALTGSLDDDIPACMSLVIGPWIIGVQDEMPDEMRNDKSWKNLLPYAAGTGRKREDEKKRQALIFAWYRKLLLPLIVGELGELNSAPAKRYVNRLIREDKIVDYEKIYAELSILLGRGRYFLDETIDTMSYDIANYLNPEFIDECPGDAIAKLSGASYTNNNNKNEWWAEKAKPAALLRKLILVGWK